MLWLRIVMFVGFVTSLVVGYYSSRELGKNANHNAHYGYVTDWQNNLNLQATWDHLLAAIICAFALLALWAILEIYYLHLSKDPVPPLVAAGESLIKEQ